jgi:hypothetical protein
MFHKATEQYIKENFGNAFGPEDLDVSQKD